MLANYQPTSAITTTVDLGNLQRICQVVTDTVDSPHSKRVYQRALVDFLTWFRDSGSTELNKATVLAYASHLKSVGKGAVSINQCLTAIRKLATEAADNQALDPAIASGIQRVKGVKRQGKRLGNWLNKKQAEALIKLPDTSTLKGLRDRAILAVLLGCGLRRDECARLSFTHLQQRESRWVIVDLVGKGNKTRSVPMPSWAKTAVDNWAAASGISEGRIFRRVNKGDHLVGDQISDQGIHDVVKAYAAPLNLPIATHDTRRTYAKLAHKGGAALEQIQLSLGHASIKTTEIYLGIEQDLTDAPCDHLGLHVTGD